MKARIAWTAALIALASIALVSIAVLSWRSQSPGDGIHPGFTQAFIDLNGRLDDDATAVAYDPALGILAVGRDSGRLELWDVSRTEARIVRKAHSYRIEHLAFGARDGIVLSSSVGSNTTGLDPHGVPKVWDARSGALLLALPGEWLGGPLAAAPVPGFYLLSSYDELRIYDHARRAIVGEPLRVEGGITALGSEMASALVAVGSGNGGLLLLEWQDEGGIPRLQLVSRHATSGNEPRTDVLAVMLRDEGRRLVSVHWPPKAVRHDHPPQITGE